MEQNFSYLLGSDGSEDIRVSYFLPGFFPASWDQENILEFFLWGHSTGGDDGRLG